MGLNPRLLSYEGPYCSIILLTFNSRTIMKDAATTTIDIARNLIMESLRVLGAPAGNAIPPSCGADGGHRGGDSDLLAIIG